MATKYVQAQRAVLQASINDSATSCTLTNFLDLSSNAITQTDIGTIGYGTFAPNTDKEEAVSFTIDSNTAGVAVLTITRGLLGKAPYGTGGTAFAHDAGTEFVISNNPDLLNKLTAKDNDEIVTGSWEFPAPTADQSPATKLYVDEVVTGGTVSQNRVVVAGTAGATLVAGDLVYFDDTDNEWKKTAGATAATLDRVVLGIAQGAGVDTGAIAGGVLLFGLDSTQTGMTVGVKLYAGDTAGSIVETPGTVEKCIGFSRSATELYFNPFFNSLPTADEKDAMTGTSGTPSTTNKYVTANDVATDSTADKIVRLSGVSGVSRVLATSTSTTEIADNTGTETNIFSESLAANVLASGNAVRFKVFVENFTQLSITPAACTFRLKLGSTTLATLSLGVNNGGPDETQGIIEGTVISDGSSSQLGTIRMFTQDRVVDPDTVSGNTINAVSSGTGSEDSTVELTLSLTIQWAGANTGNDFVPAGYIIELIS